MPPRFGGRLTCRGSLLFFFFQAEDGIRDLTVTGVQTCALPIFALVLYEWLTGKFPFQVSAGLIPREIVHTELEPLRNATPEIPETLEQLVAQIGRASCRERV